MHTEHKREAPNVDLGYETRDIDYKGLGRASLYFIVFVIFAFGSVGVWFAMVQPKTQSVLDPTKPIPAITVQSNIAVRADIEKMRQDETEVLSTSGKNADGTTRIPIDKAIDIIAARGLASKTTQVKAESPGNTIKQNANPPAAQGTPQPGATGPIGAIATPGAAKP